MVISLDTISIASLSNKLSLSAHSTKRNPVSYVSLIDKPVIKTPSHRVHSHSSFDITFTLHEGQQPIRLVLQPNHDLLHDDFSVTYLGGDGQVSSIVPVPQKSHRVFKGKAFVQRDGRWDWEHAGWARIAIRRDGKNPIFEGAFRINGDSHHIQTSAHYLKVKHDNDPSIAFRIENDDEDEVMVVYRDSDIMPDYAFTSELKRDISSPSCGSDSLDFNTKYDKEMRRSLQDNSLASISVRSLFGRQSIEEGGMGEEAGANYVPDIGSIAGCPSTRKVALVGIATDCTYWEDFDGNREDIAENVINMVNQASQLYEDTFSISLGIKNLTITDNDCTQSSSDLAPWNLPCSKDTSLNDRLNLFSSWRGRFEDQNAYWTLLTTCNTESAVGLAWRGQLCRTGSAAAQDTQGRNETIAATNVVVRTSAEWQIFAHETGHTFGAVHDCTEDDCPVDSISQSCCPLSANNCDAAGKFIMNPSTGKGITNFSPCSVGNICSGLARNINGNCLTDNKNVGTFTGSQCGNGIVENGEECDCGGTDECDQNDCCDAATCKFKDGAVCDPINEDCCDDKCQFLSGGTVCRASTSGCDPEEMCSGDSGSCPRDEWKDDGDSCGNGLTCASGQCTSRDMQCRVMMSDLREDDNGIKACGGDDTCLLTCSSPVLKNGTCFRFNYNLIDGTACGGGGRCQSGVCEGGSTWGRITEWFKTHQKIAIPVGCVVGALILISLFSCIWSHCKRRRMRKRLPKQPHMTSGGSNSPVEGYIQNRSQRNLAGRRQGRNPQRPPPGYGQVSNRQTPPGSMQGHNQPNPPEYTYQPPEHGSQRHPGHNYGPRSQELGQWAPNQNMRYA